MSVSISNFGNSYDSRPDIVLICPHGDDGAEFINQHNIKQLVTDPVVFDKYNLLETDRGSRELTIEIAKQIVAKSNNLMVEVVDVQIPRSVLDCNRIPGRELRRVADWNNNQVLANELSSIHTEVINLVLARLANMSRKGVYLDVHTMADYSPVGASFDVNAPALEEYHEDLEGYVSNFLVIDNDLQKRSIDLICSNGSTLLADLSLLHGVEQVLQNSGVPIARNRPYALNSRIMSNLYAETYSGLTVDFLKGSLLGGSKDILFSPIDSYAVTEVATPFSRALIERLSY